MANVQDLLELGGSRNCTRSQHVCECLQGCDFEKDLDLVDCVALARHANSKTIVCKGCVAVVVDSLVYVAVVVVVERNVPVAAIESNTVCEKLDHIWSSLVWCTASNSQYIVQHSTSVEQRSVSH